MRITEDDYKKAIFSVSSDIYSDQIPDAKDIDILFCAAKKRIGKAVKTGIGKYKAHKCPCCNTAVARTHRYCCQCGQKLDWR